MRAIARTIPLHLAAAVTALLVAGGAARAELASHRAIYSMTLAWAGYGSDVVEVSGQMVIEVADVCDGWTLEQRTARRFVNSDGDEFHAFSTFASWESKDGTRFRFVQKTRHDGETIEEFSGRAVKAGAKGGVAYLTKPKEFEIPLPPGTLFPFEHTAQLLARAMAGETHFVRVVFDGSTLDNPNRVSAFIGRRTKVPGLTEGSGPQTAWPIRLAFFPLRRATPEPDVEIGLSLQADGIARELDLDYGNFRIHAELDEIELLETVRC